MTESEHWTLPSPAWARVRILLNRGLVQEATAAANEAAEHTPWGEDFIQITGPRIYALPEVPVGWVFLDPYPGLDLAVVHPGVVEEFGMRVCLFQFVRVPLSGPAFRWFDLDNWRLLAGMSDAEWEARER